MSDIKHLQQYDGMRFNAWDDISDNYRIKALNHNDLYDLCIKMHEDPAYNDQEKFRILDAKIIYSPMYALSHTCLLIKFEADCWRNNKWEPGWCLFTWKSGFAGDGSRAKPSLLLRSATFSITPEQFLADCEDLHEFVAHGIRCNGYGNPRFNSEDLYVKCPRHPHLITSSNEHTYIGDEIPSEKQLPNAIRTSCVSPHMSMQNFARENAEGLVQEIERLQRMMEHCKSVIHKP